MIRRSLLACLMNCALAFAALAVPYNTIQVNGTWDAGEWDPGNETVATNSQGGWGDYGDVKAILLTWDAVNLYVAVRGNSWNNAMLIYIDSSSIVTGQENSDYFQGFDTQSFFDPDFVAGHFNMEWGAGAVPTDIRSISAVDGSTTSLIGVADIAVHDRNHDGGLGDGLTEIAIPWSLIGLEPGGSVSVAASAGWAVELDPVIPAGGLGGFTGDELGGADQPGGNDGIDSTLDGPVEVVYDADEDGLPDQLADNLPPVFLDLTVLEGDASVLVAHFDEELDETSAESLSNYTIDGGLTLTAATLQEDAAIVHLQADAEAGYGASYTLTAVNIEDTSGNPCDEQNESFCRAELTFFLHMKYRLLDDPTGPQDVGIEGSVPPLSWDPTCDDLLYDDGSHGDAAAGDSIYTTQIDFCLSYGDGEEPPTTPLLFKFTYGCTEWESLEAHYYSDPGLTCSTGRDTLDIWWNDENPDNYTTQPIDVVFSVDLSDSLPGTVGLNGGNSDGSAIPPLNWNVPSETILSDADYHGGETGDGIFGAVVRFPASSLREVEYKFLFNDSYECSDQGNRGLYLNDAAYDTIGGAMGPLLLPIGVFDRCSVTGRAVEVVFRADLGDWHDPPIFEDVIAVNGGPAGADPQVINWDIPSINPMADDGVVPDEAAGDLVYSRSVVFPDSSAFHVEYKFLYNEAYECTTQANRYFWIDPLTYDAVGNPQLLGPDVFNLCSPVGVGEGPIQPGPARLHGNWPNPFNPTTTLRFSLEREAEIELAVYDVAGRHVRTLISDPAPAGDHLVQWSGRDASGRAVPSGIYFARLTALGRVETQKMTMLK